MKLKKSNQVNLEEDIFEQSGPVVNKRREVRNYEIRNVMKNLFKVTGEIFFISEDEGSAACEFI